MHAVGICGNAVCSVRNDGGFGTWWLVLLGVWLLP